MMIQHIKAYKYLMDQDVLDDDVVLRTRKILMKDATSKNITNGAGLSG